MLFPTVAPTGDGLETNTCVHSRRVLRIVLGVIGTLLILSVAGQVAKYVFNHDQVFGLVRLTYVSAEGNLPTFYSALALLMCAVLLWMCGQVAHAQRDRFARQWITLSLMFLYIAIDEASGIHELTGKAIKRVVMFDGFLYYPWVLVGSTAVLIAAVSFFAFARALPRRTRRLALIAAAVFVGGAIGVEMLGARHASVHGTQNLTNALIATVEEACEMLGVALFMYALIRHLEEARAAIVIRFGASPLPVSMGVPELAGAGLASLRPILSAPGFQPITAFRASATGDFPRLESA
jgi:alkylhydroperoxidase/carboxymuconolactone decarboxylase family protein YurZ